MKNPPKADFFDNFDAAFDGDYGQETTENQTATKPTQAEPVKLQAEKSEESRADVKEKTSKEVVEVQDTSQGSEILATEASARQQPEETQEKTQEVEEKEETLDTNPAREKKVDEGFFDDFDAAFDGDYGQEAPVSAKPKSD